MGGGEITKPIHCTKVRIPWDNLAKVWHHFCNNDGVNLILCGQKILEGGVGWGRKQSSTGGVRPRHLLYNEEGTKQNPITSEPFTQNWSGELQMVTLQPKVHWKFCECDVCMCVAVWVFAIVCFWVCVGNTFLLGRGSSHGKAQATKLQAYQYTALAHGEDLVLRVLPFAHVKNQHRKRISRTRNTTR